MDLSLILFFCSAPVILACQKIMGIIGLSKFGYYLGIVLIYLPLLLSFIKSPKRIPLDFVLLLVLMVFYFLVTLLFHPEYDFFYRRNYYGVWDYVLRPDNGVYAYLFLRTQKDPKHLIKLFRYCAYIMLIYSLYRLVGALSKGYWVISTNADGSEHRMSYNLGFGYDTLLFTLFALFAALKEGKKIDWGFGLGGVLIILLGGSRGPILDLGIFFFIYMLISFQHSKKKVRSVFLIVTITILLVLSYQWLLLQLGAVMNKIGISSRFIRKLLEGSIASDSGRNIIWSAAIEMIKAHPLGYGAMGTRHVIYYIIDVGHPHNIFLELLVDTGVIIGSIIIITMIVRSVQIFRMSNNTEWVGIYLIFFSASCQLLVSGTLWHRLAIWAAAGISINIAREQRAKRRLIYGK